MIKSLSILLGGEILHLLAPGRQGIYNTPNQLLDTVFPLGTSQMPANVFTGYYVGRSLRPKLREFQILLPKSDLTRREILDFGGPAFPPDLVKRVFSFLGKVGLNVEPRRHFRFSMRLFHVRSSLPRIGFKLWIGAHSRSPP